MTDIIKDLEKLGSWNAMREELGRLLNLSGPVESAVLARARVDDRFAGHLFISRFDNELLTLFLNDEKNKIYALHEIPVAFTNGQLVKKASKALVEWGKSGFKKVSKELYDKRLDACDGCEFIKDPPSQLVYLRFKRESDPRICGACGCGVSRKAWLATETCPVGDPSRPGLNFWNEPMAGEVGKIAV